MTLLAWIKYCRDRVAELNTADEINYGKQFDYLRAGKYEEYVCNKGCNPWHCEDCCDGFGLSCGFKMSDGRPIPYYIPDPFSQDEQERKDWHEMVKLLPAVHGEQQKLF